MTVEIVALKSILNRIHVNLAPPLRIALTDEGVSVASCATKSSGEIIYYCVFVTVANEENRIVREIEVSKKVPGPAFSEISSSEISVRNDQSAGFLVSVSVEINYTAKVVSSWQGRRHKSIVTEKSLWILFQRFREMGIVVGSYYLEVFGASEEKRYQSMQS